MNPLKYWPAQKKGPREVGEFCNNKINKQCDQIPEPSSCAVLPDHQLKTDDSPSQKEAMAKLPRIETKHYADAHDGETKAFLFIDATWTIKSIKSIKSMNHSRSRSKLCNGWATRRSCWHFQQRPNAASAFVTYAKEFDCRFVDRPTVQSWRAKFLWKSGNGFLGQQ